MSDRPPVSIIDAHQHFWDLNKNYHPWLNDEPLIPFRYGDYSAIRRNYLPEDLKRDSAEFRLIGTVYVEAEWDPTDGLGETQWVHDLANKCGLPNAMVAQAWLNHDDVAEMLAAQASYPLVRGVRDKPAVMERGEKIPIGGSGSMSDPRWRAGFALLASHDLSFDLQAPWWHFEEAAQLAIDFPTTRIMVNHTGLPVDRSETGLAEWRAMLEKLADCPNVALKISGLGQPQPAQRWTVQANAPIVLDAIRIFGTDRCMFASNFPVDSLVATYSDIFRGFLQITESFSALDRQKLFRDNAKRFYRIFLEEDALCG